MSANVISLEERSRKSKRSGRSATLPKCAGGALECPGSQALIVDRHNAAVIALVVTCLMVVAAGVALWGAGSSLLDGVARDSVYDMASDQSVASNGGENARSITVRPGDTVWAIARRYAPEGADVRQAVDWILSANGLSGPKIRPGQTLWVPAQRSL